MSLDWNKVTIAGRLTSDPELKMTPNSVPVTSFTLAVNRPFAKPDDAQKADFISVVAWRKTAEFIVNYFRKGSALLVHGSLQTRSWTDQNGNKRYATEVVADEARFVESKGAQENTFTQQKAPAQEAQQQFEELSSEDDLPF